MATVGAAAQSSAAISLCVSLMEILVTKKVISKDEALEILDTLSVAKRSKAVLHQSREEDEAHLLLDHLRKRFSDKTF